MGAGLSGRDSESPSLSCSLEQGSWWRTLEELSQTVPESSFTLLPLRISHESLDRGQMCFGFHFKKKKILFKCCSDL